MNTHPLPTARYAGAFLIELDPTRYWSGVSGVVHGSDGSAWLDYARLPVAGGSENRVLSYEIADHADQPVRTLRATLQMSTTHDGVHWSLSSGATNSPLNNLSGSFAPAIFGKRRVIVQDPLADPASTNPADWRPRFWGYIDDHPASSSGDLRIFARDAAARLMVPYTGEPVQIGPEGGAVSLHDAAQAILDAAMGAGEWSLLTEDDLDWAFPSFTWEGEEGSVLEALTAMAQQRGAVVRWWPDPVTGRFQLRMFVLQVDKSAPDHTFGPGDTFDVPGHGSDTTSYRNDFTLRYVDSSGNVQTIRRPATQAEKDAFGFEPLLIGEGSTSHIRTAAEANTMLDAVEGALRVPATVGSRVLPRTPTIEVNSLIRFLPDARVAQEYSDLYVVGWSETRRVDESSTVVELRGAPVGRIAAYLESFERRPTAPGAALQEYRLVNFREVPAPEGFRRWAWDDRGALVAEVWWAYRKYAEPWAEDNWSDLAGRVLPLPPGQDWVQVPDDVTAGESGALWVEPRLADLTVHDEDVIERVRIYPVPPQVNPWISAEYAEGVVNVYAGADPTASALPIMWQIRQGPDAEILLASGTWRTMAEASEGSAALNQNPPEAGRRTYWLRTTDSTGGEAWTSTGVENPERRVGDGALDRISAFAASFAPIQRVSALPAEGTREGERVLLWDTNSPDHKTIWRWDGSAWGLVTEADQSIVYPGVVVAHSVTAVEMSTVDLAVWQHIGSHNYAPGEQGWVARGDGTAEFQDVVVRGIITADSVVAATTFTAETANFTGSAFVAGGLYLPSTDPEDGIWWGAPSAVPPRIYRDGRDIHVAHANLHITDSAFGEVHARQLFADDARLGPPAGTISPGHSLEVRGGNLGTDRHTNIFFYVRWDGLLRRCHLRLDDDQKLEAVFI